jgi:hypothetical protein
MGDPRPRYLSYLIRLWQVEAGGRNVWRASAESPHTGERHAFAGLELLFSFLEDQTARAALPPAGSDSLLERHPED